MANDINYEELKNVSARVAEMQKNNLAIQSKNMLENINNELNSRAIIPEAVFRHYFLNTFIRYIVNKGTLKGTQEQIQQDDYNLRKWLELANGPYNEVDVIDVNNNVVLTVPSLYMENTNIIDKLAEFDFEGMAKAYHSKAAMVQAMGENDMMARLQHMPKFIDQTGINEYRQKWIEVANYYKRITEPEVKTTKPHANTNVKQKQEDLGIDFN